MRSPLFYLTTRLQLKAALRRKGLSFRDANEAAALLADEDIDTAAAAPEVSAPAFAAADGTHPILDALLAFFASDLGKALIAMLIKMLGL